MLSTVVLSGCTAATKTVESDHSGGGRGTMAEAAAAAAELEQPEDTGGAPGVGRGEALVAAAGGGAERLDGGVPVVDAASPVHAPAFLSGRACRKGGGKGGVAKFTEETIQTHPLNDGTGVGVEIGFFNGDGLPDLFTAYSLSNGHVTAPTVVNVHPGGGRLGRVGSAVELVDVGDPNYARVVDVNGDGLQDIVNRTTVALSDGMGFGEVVELEWKAGVTYWGKLNGDRFADSLVGTQEEFVVRMGDGEGGFSEGRSISHKIDKFWNLSRVELFDVTNDGNDDLVTFSHPWPTTELPYPPAEMIVYENLGAGTAFGDGLVLAPKQRATPALTTAGHTNGRFPPRARLRRLQAQRHRQVYAI